MRDALAVRSKRLHRRIYAQVAVRAVGVLPPLMPVKRCFEARITGTEQFQPLLDPRWFADSARRSSGKRKLDSRPFRNHDGLERIKTAHFFVWPVNQRRNIRVRLILVLLSVDAESEPIHVIRPR